MPETPVLESLSKGPAGPGCAKVDPILVADKVTRQFGGLTAVDVDHVEIPRGAITALIGPNGAGKTTLFNLLTGFDNPNTGDWAFDGTNLAGIPSSKVRTEPRRHTFQEGIAASSVPSTAQSPVVGSSTPVRRLNRVVFPAPVGPIRAVMAPRGVST